MDEPLDSIESVDAGCLTEPFVEFILSWDGTSTRRSGLLRHYFLSKKVDRKQVGQDTIVLQYNIVEGKRSRFPACGEGRMEGD